MNKTLKKNRNKNEIVRFAFNCVVEAAEEKLNN